MDRYHPDRGEGGYAFKGWKVVALVNLNDLSVTKELVVRATVYDVEGKPMSQFEGKYPAIVSFDLAEASLLRP